MHSPAKALAVLIVLALAASGCSGQPSASPVDVVTSLQLAAPDEQVAAVQVTVSGPDQEPRVVELAREGARWNGVLEALPANVEHTFLGEAFNAAGERLYEGTASGQALSPDGPAALYLLLQASGPPAESLAVPLITSLMVSPATVAVGGKVELTATVRGSGAGGEVGAAWAASQEGSFSGTGALESSWTAESAQPAELMLTVTEEAGSSSTLSVKLPAKDSAAPSAVTFNAWPLVHSGQVSPTVTGVRQTVSVSVSGVDLEGDTLSYSWGAGCVGQWEGATSATARFTPTVQLPVAQCARCPLTVTVSDEHGGRMQRTLETCVRPGRAAAPAMATGGKHSLIIRSGGTVWTWGDNSRGQLGTGSDASSQSTPVQVPGLSEISTVAAGSYHSVALRSDGTVFTWGENTTGQLGDGTTTNRHTPIQVASLSNVVAIGASSWTSLALRSDGSIWAWGDGRAVPTKVATFSNIVALAAGHQHTLLLRSDGALFSWGSNASGQLGDGTNTDRTTPGHVPTLSNIVSIAAGQMHSLALRADGAVFAWGSNQFGGLGNGSLITDTLNTPRQIAALSNVTAISAGISYSAALRSDGTVFTWGAGAFTPTQVAPLSNVSAIAASNQCLALRADGTLFTWDAQSSPVQVLSRPEERESEHE